MKYTNNSMKKFIYILIFLPIFLFSIGNNALADDNFGLDETATEITAYQDQMSNTYDEPFVASTIGNIIGTVLSFVGVIFLILIIYGGISWMFSAGNDQKVEKAKSIIINAVIGLIIVFAAYFITDFIGTQFIN